MKKSEYKLDFCPFCGGYANPKFEEFGEVVWIQCEVCGSRTSKYNMSDIVDGKTGGQRAIEAWNRRTRHDD